MQVFYRSYVKVSNVNDADIDMTNTQAKAINQNTCHSANTIAHTLRSNREVTQLQFLRSLDRSFVQRGGKSSMVQSPLNFCF